jgi:hypothetical protein
MKYILSIFLFVSLCSSLNAQSFLGGEIVFDDNPLVGFNQYYIHLYYSDTNVIKDYVNVYYASDFSSDSINKINMQKVTDGIYKVTYKGSVGLLGYGTASIRYIDTMDMSGVVNINNPNYPFIISFMVSDLLPGTYLMHASQTPVFDYPPTFINIDGSTASLSFQCSQYISDTIIYTTDSTWYDGQQIPLPTGFSFDEHTAQLSWDTTLTGKYLINIGVWQNHRGLAVTTATYRTIIVDTDMDNSLYIPVSTKPIQPPKFTLNLHPNPTSETLQITTDSPVDAIQIYNSIGQQVWQGQGFRENQVRVNVRDFSEGMYIVRVRQGESWVSEQVLVIRN